MESFVRAIQILYLTLLGFLCVYGLHRYLLVYLYYKHRDNLPRVRESFKDLPNVTVQLPMYNERYVARRIIEHACRIDYPPDRLQIQVLDDSTDQTTATAETVVAQMRRLGHNIELIHRTNREGFKAGALQEGLKTATGEFICIFDADFIPPENILTDTINHFTDERVGMVQARWDHINRDHSLLTKTEAILLDGHFVMEHGARNRARRFMSFNGTAGIWRKSCIIDAGGWQHDTLTEDMDLSYRAQLKGWQFLFLPDLISPAELPPDIVGFKAQQYRWAKGGAQTCRKMLPTILRSPFSNKIKLEAFFHLTSCVVSLFMVVITVLLFPVMYLSFVLPSANVISSALFGLALFIVASCSAGSFYACSQRELLRSWSDALKYLPFLMALGVGMSLNNSRAVLSGLFGRVGEFVRTPKFGVEESSDTAWKKKAAYRNTSRKVNWQPWVELAMGVYLTGCLLYAVSTGYVVGSLFFVGLFAVGYLYVATTSLARQYVPHPKHSTQPAPPVAASGTTQSAA